MSSLRFVRVLVCIGAFLVAVLFADAQVVLLGNMPSNGSVGTAVNSGGADRFAAVFTMPATSYTVDSVVVTLSGFFGSPEVVTLGFYTDGGATPGSLVGGTLTQPAGSGSDSSSATNYTFTTGSTVPLSANTKYWMVLSVPTGMVGWSWSNSDPSGPASFDGYYLSSNSGASFVHDTSAARFALQINASAIPEPSTYATIAAGCALALAVWRRRWAAARTLTS